MNYKKITYKEFKKEVEELGLRCEFYCYGVNVYSIDDYTIVTIYNTKQYNGVINFRSISSGIKSNKLLNLCCELMQTPPNERGEIK